MAGKKPTTSIDLTQGKEAETSITPSTKSMTRCFQLVEGSINGILRLLEITPLHLDQLSQGPKQPPPVSPEEIKLVHDLRYQGR